MGLRVMLTTGGTGGHIFPALAVAEALKRRLPDADILFVGGLYGPEADLARKAGLEFTGLKVRGMLGRGIKALPALLAMARGIAQAYSLVGSWKPDAVMGFGGYAAFATVFAAWLRSRPTGIHEQNAIPGLANTILGKVARRVCLSWPDSSRDFPRAACVDTGNPIREDIAALGRDRHKNAALFPRAGENGKSRPRLLVMGGSQGARAINSLVIAMLAALRDAGTDIRHQTGAKDLARVREAYKSHGYSPEDAEDMVLPFLDDMAGAYAWADLVLCRAGATTLAELAATGSPSILVPYPYAAHDHQTGNALTMRDAGGALLLREQEAQHKDTAGICLDLLTDFARLNAMSAGAMTLARPDAADAVAREIILLATNKSA